MAKRTARNRSLKSRAEAEAPTPDSRPSTREVRLTDTEHQLMLQARKDRDVAMEQYRILTLRLEDMARVAMLARGLDPQRTVVDLDRGVLIETAEESAAAPTPDGS